MNQTVQTPEQAIKFSQTISMALFAGIVFFGGVAVLVGFQTGSSGDPFISYVLAGISLGPIFASIVVPAFFTPERAKDAQMRTGQQVSAEVLPYQIMMGRNLVRFALLEGAGMINLVGFILEQQWWSLGIAVMVLLFMAINFPTKSKFDQYAETLTSFGS